MQTIIEKLVRTNIRRMKPYSSARNEYTGAASIFLDANENAFGSPLPEDYNRYPDPLQLKLKEKLSGIKQVAVQNIFLGNGSDEAIDILFRIFCDPGKDNIILLPPTYGMYEVCAAMNDVKIKRVSLSVAFQPEPQAILKAVDSHTKMIFLCSPNNPTGNCMNRQSIEFLLKNFSGILVIDEAYINYASEKTWMPELNEHPNLVILQTLSKAWGLAGLRLGMAFASEFIIQYMNKVKYPYNISTATQKLALAAFGNMVSVNKWTQSTLMQRESIQEELSGLTDVHVFPSDANFLLVRFQNAKKVYDYLASRGIIVRDRSNVELCEECLRITIGTPEENKFLLEAIKEYKS